MAAPIYYPNNTFRNEDGNQFVDTTVVAQNVVFGGELSRALVLTFSPLR
jgi:hypothetical protein